MNNPKPSFHKTVNILVQAYLNDTLEHGNCFACAVGNIVADGIGVKTFLQGKHQKYWSGFNEDLDYPARNAGTPQGWGAVFATDMGRQKIDSSMYDGCSRARFQIDSTGYHWKELARIEFAFEKAIDEEGDEMFNGLMAVVDVLAKIHNVDLSVKEQAKLLFAKP